jgi:hypothetical protein
MEQYELDPQYLDAAKKISEVGQLLRDDAISKNFSPKAEYAKQLNILTGWYMFIVVEFKKWRSIKENNETAKYCQLKQENITKFVSIAAEKEASNFVGKERYFRDFLEGLLLAAEQGIYTLKKHLGEDKQEEKFS